MNTEVTVAEIRKQAFKDAGEMLSRFILNHRETEVQGSIWNKRMRWFIDTETGSPFWRLVLTLIQGKLGEY